jgi:hypothetical protein
MYSGKLFETIYETITYNYTFNENFVYVISQYIYDTYSFDDDSAFLKCEILEIFESLDIA